LSAMRQMRPGKHDTQSGPLRVPAISPGVPLFAAGRATARTEEPPLAITLQVEPMRIADGPRQPSHEKTIGFWLTCPFDVIVKCPCCGNNRTLKAEQAVSRYGPDVTVREYFG